MPDRDDPPPLSRAELRVFLASLPVAVGAACLVCLASAHGVVTLYVTRGVPDDVGVPVPTAAIAVMMLPVCALITQIGMALWLVAWRIYAALPFRKGRRR